MEGQGGEAGNWLTAKQVAKRYGLTVQWVYHCKDLQAIGHRFGKYIRYREDQVIEFEEKREVGVRKRPRTGCFGYNLKDLSARRIKELKNKLKFDIA